jgi:hypothetical protein
MKYSMLVKCEKCGYENFPQHRFCGMCAAALPFPKGPSARPNPEPPPPVTTKIVHRPPPAALEREPVDVRSLSYLLEDEPAPSHRGKYLLALILLLAAGAVIGWNWRESLGSLVSRFSSSADRNSQGNSSASAASESTSAATPATGASAGGEVEKARKGNSDHAQAPPSTAASASAAPSAGDSDQSPAADQPSSQLQPSDAASATGVPKPDESAEAASQPAPVVKPSQVRAQPATASGVDDLEAEGEKYLYGNSVPENCARARKSLLAAAQHSSAKAQNVLGTMYATGHCATRDLPTAYRWFSRSLRKDPGNTRIEQDLKVLWNQMTPEEQKLALRAER